MSWLEAHNRRVVNGRHVLELEVSKVEQHLALSRGGFEVPRTVAVFGKGALVARARELPVPFIAKHNQGGKGLGVRRFDRHRDFQDYVASPDFEESPDGITLLQEYLEAREPFVTRIEFVGGRYVYAVRSRHVIGELRALPGGRVRGAPSAGPALLDAASVSDRHPLILPAGDVPSRAPDRGLRGGVHRDTGTGATWSTT